MTPLLSTSVATIDPGRSDLLSMPVASSVTGDNFIVFVVDDDPAVRDSLALLIEPVGWQAETFASAQEFLGRPRPMSDSN